MSRFNLGTRSATPPRAKAKLTTNLAGGTAYEVDPKFQLVSLLLTSFVQDQFYRSAGDQLTELTDLVRNSNYEFAAKAAIYARNEFGMRSITHALAAQIAREVKGETWTKHFFDQVFKRPDDMLETVAAYAAFGGAGKILPLANSLKKGIRTRLAQLNEYSLAKYRGEGKDVKMVDLCNLTHPQQTTAIQKLMKGELKNVDTWESQLSEAGQADDVEQVAEGKKQAWGRLLSEDKLGYIALIRNVKNICAQAPECVPLLCEKLQNREAIKKSLVFPFQIYKAMKMAPSRETIVALSNALEISMDNCPSFEGKTCIVIDSSGSMTSANIAKMNDTKVCDIAAVFGAVLYKKSNADVVLFDTTAKKINPPPMDSVFSIASEIRNAMTGGGTDFTSIFRVIANKKYDRLIILSDMQGWGEHGLQAGFAAWKKNTGSNPFLHSWDLAGYGTSKFPESQVFLLAGFSDKVFNIMKMLEADREALVKEIEKVNIQG